MVNSVSEFDVVIVGAGIVGLTAARMLSEYCDRVALIDQGEASVWHQDDAFDLRVSALNLASIELFKANDVWHSVQSMRVYPYSTMHVWEGDQDASVSFNASDTAHDILGVIVENNVLSTALSQMLEGCANVTRFTHSSLQTLTAISDAAMLAELDNGTKLSAKLVIGADGQRSKVRESVGIGVAVQSYNQMGVVCNVLTQQSHQQTAWQCFTEHGPLALLPLSEQQCSVVWSVPENISNDLLAMDDAAFNSTITTAFKNELGEITLTSARKKFPLQGAQADSYIEQRVVLMGDAAHTVHPLAGLGLNLGLEDVATLVNLIKESPRPLGSERVLSQYARARSSENLLMQRSLELIDNLFIQENAVYKTLRSTGFKLTDKFLPLKLLFMRRALGVPI